MSIRAFALLALLALADAQPHTANRTRDWGKPEYRHCTNPYNWTELVHGYKDARVTFKSGGLGSLMEDGAYEVWVCLHEHYCGDPWFCFVYHEGEKEFSAWGPNSKLDLIRETHPQDEIERLWATWSQLKALSETTQEQVRAVGNFLYHVKEEALNEKSKPARRLSIFRGVENARAAPSFQSNRVLVVAPWNRDDENDYPSYDDIVEYVTQTRLGATLLTEDEIRANRSLLLSTPPRAPLSSSPTVLLTVTTSPSPALTQASVKWLDTWPRLVVCRESSSVCPYSSYVLPFHPPPARSFFTGPPVINM